MGLHSRAIATGLVAALACVTGCGQSPSAVPLAVAEVSPVADGSAEQDGAMAADPGVAGSDALAEDGDPDAGEVSGADSNPGDSGDMDIAADAAAETNGDDAKASGADTEPDAGAETTIDVATDSAADAKPDAAADTTVDVATDTAADIKPDSAADATVDGTADSAADASSPCAGKSCDDADACTKDSCDAKSGACSHTANQLCGNKGKSLPYSSAFDCGSPDLADWKTTGTPGGPSWAFDADGSTFEFPGYQSPKCSANFNNGLDYQCPSTGVKQVSGTLTSPTLDGTMVQPGQLVYLDLWLAGQFSSDDQLVLETTIDGLTWQSVRSYSAFQMSAKKWKLFVDPLVGVAGKNFAWRLRFTSVDCTYNNQPRVFVDDVKVYAAAPCAQTDAWAKQNFDSYGGYNVGSFQMGSSPSLTLDPKGSVAPGVTKVVYWYVFDSSTDKMEVDMTYEASAPVDVCVQHQCYKSKAYACTATCPAGTTKTLAGDGCCRKGQASGDFAFKPIGNGITSGFTKVFLTNKGTSCLDVKVKSYF